MALVEQSSDLDDAVDQFYDSMSMPITSCSKFYTYYYLAEIVDIEEVAFDLFNVKSELADSFYNYAIYACGRELRNVRDGYGIDEKPLEGVTDDEIVNEIVDHLRYSYEDDVAELCRVALFEPWPHSPDDRDREGVGKICSVLERQFSAFTNGDTFLDVCKVIFSGDFVPPFLDVEHGWDPSFGGEAWEGIAETAQRGEELTKTMYVDLMWSVEHNNRVFVDKVNFSKEERRRLRRFSSAAGDLAPFEKVDRIRVYNNWLPWFLDNAREEKMGPIMAYAVKEDREIRTYKHKLPEDIAEWI